MVNFTILAGGFANIISAYNFDSDSASLVQTLNTTVGDAPSWIALHPQNSGILYAVNEVQPVGQLQSFTVQPDGRLQLGQNITTGGSAPTFTNPLSTGEVTAMNFGSPNASIIATDPNDPLVFVKDSPIIEFPVNGGPSNPHMSLQFKDEVFIPDLGADKIWRVGKDNTGVFKVQGQIDVAKGNGPRHIAIRGDILFTLNEITSTLTAQPIPVLPTDPTLPLIANVSIVPDGFNASDYRAAEIVISEPTDEFPTPLIYVSNRRLSAQVNEQGDSIAIFEFVTGNPAAASSDAQRRRNHSRDMRRQEQTGSGSLVLQNQVFTGLDQIRSFAVGPMCDGLDAFLIAGGSRGGGVVMFKRVEQGRNLELVARNTVISSRTSFVFL